MFVTPRRNFLFQKLLFALLKKEFPARNIKEGFPTIFLRSIEQNDPELSEPSRRPHTLFFQETFQNTSTPRSSKCFIPSESPVIYFTDSYPICVPSTTAHLFHLGFTAQIILATKYKLLRFILLIFVRKT